MTCNKVSTTHYVERDCRSWHMQDRERWMDLFDPDRMLGDPVWVRQTQYQNAAVYSRYLTACLAAGNANPRFVTPRGVQCFIQACEILECRPRTIAGYVWCLFKISRLLWPSRHCGWLSKTCCALDAIAEKTTKKKIAQIPQAEELLWLAYNLLHQARAAPIRNWNATQLFRTGLYILIGVYMPERLRALASIDIAQIDFESGMVRFDRDVIKNKTDRPRVLPAAVLDALREWIDDWRLAWISTRASYKGNPAELGHNKLWIGKSGRPAGDSTLTVALRDVTTQYFGFAVTSHRFRDAAATLHVEAAPGETRLAMQNLGHKSGEMTAEYTETATQVRAGQHFAAALGATEEDVRYRVRANSHSTIALNLRSRRKRPRRSLLERHPSS